MTVEAVTLSDAETPLDVLRRYLDSDNEVLRSAAVRALPGVLADTQAMRGPLIAALLDPDPDVRGDAMEALAEIARPEDADTIRRSLAGDPVREVKLAAVAALARLDDRASVGLLRSLVLSRCEEDVAWEDEGGDWEDWLDVQIAAIAALGEMRVGEAIEDLIAARADELGQALDVQVFEALGRMGAAGVEQLLAVIRTEDGLARQRAAEALARVSPETLVPHIDGLLASEDPQLRVIALSALAPDDRRIRESVIKDPDAAVRLAALHRTAPLDPDLALRALTDKAPEVQAAALGHLQPPAVPALREALVDNMLAWLDTAPAVLMTAAARHLPALAPDRAEEPVLALIADKDRPLEARVAGVAALGAAGPTVATETFVDLLANPAQQVRAAALVILRARARDEDITAVEAIAEAIAGTLLSHDAAVIAPDGEEDGRDASAPKGEGAGAGRIRITPEGDIVAMDPAAPADEGGQSTLSSILGDTTAPEPAMAEDTPEETGAKRRKRRAVEGPREVAETLCRDTLQTCADLGLERIEAAILTKVQDSAVQQRRAAWQALARYSEVSAVCAESRAAAHKAFADEDAVVRFAAFAVLARHGGGAELIAAAAADRDALLRAAAVAALPPETAVDHLADDALTVRGAAVERVLAGTSGATVSSAVDRLLTAERSDTLAALASASERATAEGLSRLSRSKLPPRKALVLLNAFAQVKRVTA
ncbi:HEAT repeat domain-containing protein [Pelagibius sp.]|uniref:HEAT repeat domain-containing protein n=1 Tax=Pelagibius sp. TaxID=1931238 RepID=UPI003B50D1A7